MITLLAEISRQLGPEPTAKTLTDAHMHSDIVESHSRIRLVIRLWFASIALTLASAIFAMLAKQWMFEYTEGLALDPRRKSKQRLRREARLREFRFAGLKRWRVPEIIGALPILLHLALGLFGVGLVDLFWASDKGIAVIILIFLATTTFLYMISVMLPVFFPDSPYRTPLSHLTSDIVQTVATLFQPSVRNDVEEQTDPTDPDTETKHKLRHRFVSNGALLQAEQRAVEVQADDLDKQFLLRLKGSVRSDTIADWANGELKQLRSQDSWAGASPITPPPPFQSPLQTKGDSIPESQAQRQGSAYWVRQQVEATPAADPPGGALQFNIGAPIDVKRQV